MTPLLRAFHSVSFGGYRPVSAQEAQIYHTGDTRAQKVDVEVQTPANPEITRHAMTKNADGHGWILKQSVPAGSAYRILANGNEPRLDTVTLTYINNDPYNRIDEDLSRLNTPGTMLDVFQHSLRTQTHRKPGDLAVGRTTHFNQKTEPAAPGLEKIGSELPADSVRTIMLKPFAEGGYWPTNHYKLCPKSFQSEVASEVAFDQFLDGLLKRNQTLTMDLALLNQNMEGGQYRANLIHGARSPFNGWFLDNKAERSLQSPLARIHTEGFTHGILPTKPDPITHQRTAIDFDRFEVGFDNTPDAPGYDPLKETYLKITPTLNVSDDKIHGPEDSVHPYRFPVDPKLVREKLATAKKSHLHPASEAYKRLMMHWPAGSGSRPPKTISAQSFDDAFGKWNGKVDVPQMDGNNPDVQNYLKGALTHWVRRVMTHHRGALAQQLPETLTPDSIQQFSETRFANLKKTAPESMVINALLQARSTQPADVLSKQIAKTLVDETPISALPLPNEFLTATSVPDFQKAMADTQPGSWLQGEGFQHALRQKIEKVVNTLPESDREKLSEPLVQSQLISKMGPALFLQLLTGSANPEGAESRLSQSLPKVLLTSDPVTIARLLPAELTRRLNALPTDTLAKLIKPALSPLDPARLRVADKLLQHYALGPHLRLDAAKDVADFDPVYAAQTHADRDAALMKATRQVTDFWQELLAPAKKLFPKMTVLAELTDVGKLAGPNPALAEKAYNQFYKVFDSNPDMDHAFSTSYQVVHYAPRPFEFGDAQALPFKTVDKNGVWEQLWSRATKVPRHVQQQYQTMVSSHDYATATHNLLINPLLFFADQEPWRDVMQEVNDARMELSSKACFEPLRASLKAQGVSNPGDALYKLEQKLLTLHQNGDLTRETPTKTAFLINAAMNADNKQKANLIAPIPTDAKADLMDVITTKITPEDLGVPDDAAKMALIMAFKGLLTESSPAKAKRAILNNATHAFFEVDAPNQPSPWQRWAKAHHVDPAQGDALKAALFEALTQTSQAHGVNFGYWPLDLTLDRWLEKLPDNVLGDQKAAFKQSLFEFTLTHAQVPEKLERLTAIQVAMPGIPSISVNDLFGPGGGETNDNAMVQNRQPIDVTQPAISNDINNIQRQMTQSQLKLMQLRQTLPVLNDGLVLNPAVTEAQKEALNTAGVMPIIRDNGTDQAIVLIHTGKPQAIKEANNGWAERIGDLPTYKHPHATQAVANNFKLDLSALDFPVGTRYRDVSSGESLILNGQGQLVQTDKQGKPTDRGLDIATVRVLERV